jgi:hypothetical protein
MKASFACTLLLCVLLVPHWPKTALCLDSAKKSTYPGSQSKPLDPGWPREVDRNGIRFVYYQPQVDQWKNLRELRARVAFTLTPTGGKPTVGIEELKGDTVADLEKRTVLINNIEIVAVRFPSLPDDQAAQMETILKSNFPGKPLTVSLDRLVASLQSGQENVKPVPVKTDPPTIFATTQPAILLSVEGKPVLAPIKGSKLQFGTPDGISFLNHLSPDTICSSTRPGSRLNRWKVRGARPESFRQSSLSFLLQTVGNTSREQLPPRRAKLRKCSKSFSLVSRQS